MCFGQRCHAQMVAGSSILEVYSVRQELGYQVRESTVQEPCGLLLGPSVGQACCGVVSWVRVCSRGDPSDYNQRLRLDEVGPQAKRWLRSGWHPTSGKATTLTGTVRKQWEREVGIARLGEEQ